MVVDDKGAGHAASYRWTESDEGRGLGLGRGIREAG
jgi:hypothetical protein